MAGMHGHGNGKGGGNRGGGNRGGGGRGGGGRGGGGRGGGARGGRGGFQVMNEDELMAYSQVEPEEILQYATQNELLFLNSFKKSYYCRNTMRLKQLIKLMYNLVQSENKEFVANKLAQILCADGEYAQFNSAVDQLVKKMPMESRGFIRRENITCLYHLMVIGRETLPIIPDTVLFTFPILSIQQTMQDLLMSEESLGTLPNAVETLATSFKEEKQKLIMKKRKPKADDCTDEPPEPFTELSVLPSIKELLTDSKKVFLRSNITCGGYKNWDHYFDVQFRLLREDFIRPLREGISAHFTPSLSSRKNLSEIRVYQSARVLNPVCLYSGLGFQIKFDVSRLQRVKWEHSRRLIFGSLLCLSDDNFDKTILFATVVKRDPKLLKDGIITVKFEDNSNPFAIDPMTTFHMVESTAYFEAYRYILKRLQDLSMYPERMPMKSYIVDSIDYQKTGIKAPGFLRLRNSRPVFDLKEIIKTNRPFDITDLGKWPLSDTTGLDPSQLEALKMALTQEIALIQGPPGTGKTFIALKIAEAYLRNRHVWDPQKSSPILVVCYTNHALDQFLHEILKIQGLNPNIVRIGGRSKNEALSECLLREKVQEARSDRSIPKDLFVPFQEARTEMMRCQEYIQRVSHNCDAESKNKIINLNLLSHCMHPDHDSQLRYSGHAERNKEIEVWLGLWYPEEYAEVAVDDDIIVNDDNDDARADEDDSGEEDLIEVDNEARVLEDERMIAGVDIELPGGDFFKSSSPQNQKKREKKSDNDWKVAQVSEKKRKKLLHEGFQCKPMTKTEADGVPSIWTLTKNKKWGLYLYWVNKYVTQCKDKINLQALTYNYACAEYNEMQQKIECHVAQSADVIGMTTTGAAKYHHLLEGLHPKIAIFEEAAEVLEAHLVTSIASSVQQVILIGDHKQLRPKPTCYELEKHHNLGISLFERLVEPKKTDRAQECNAFPHVTLEVQHRMRPEISKLIHPSIYKKLVDAYNVKQYEHVKGISKDLFFISHTVPEEDTTYNDSTSHVNIFEADYVAQLCLYLLKQGYSPGEITILTMYRGQLLELKKKMKREDFEGVRVAAVDDFQGEENDIIILSLVRSNSDNSIGFLSIENRVCVSLSRAKIGLYIIGNALLLKDRYETKWPEILRYLESEGCIGRNLLLYCQNHPGDIKAIVSPEDFKTRPEGGCQKVCGERLPCGHACPRICHIRNRNHENTTCTKTCNKQFACGHFCKSKCYGCRKNMRCRPCSELVDKRLPCNHKITVHCSTDVNFVSCPKPCSTILPCGHSCRNLCTQPHTTRCREPVPKVLACGHQNTVECYKDPDQVLCSHPCQTALECGDTCEGTCGSCKHGRLHIQCKKKCGRTLFCGHHCKFPCASTCPPCNEPCNNYCHHSPCPRKCYEPCQPCMEPCLWKCAHLKCTKPCGQLCDRRPCNIPCRKILKCRHPCIGLCGEKCPSKCRICDKDEVCEFIFGTEDEEDARYIELEDCGHVFEYTGLDNWMNQESSEIQFKFCPKCKISIRKSVRYGNHIKKVLIDIDAIKKKQIEGSAVIGVALKHATREVARLKKPEFVLQDITEIAREIENEVTAPNTFRVTAMKMQLSVLPKLLRLKNILDDLSSASIDIQGYHPARADQDLLDLKLFVLQTYLTSQQQSDIYSEERRISCSIKFLDLYYKLSTQGKSVSQSHLDCITENITKLNNPSSIDQVTQIIEKECLDFIEKLSEVSL